MVGPGAKQSGPISFVTEINQSAVTSVYPTQASSWESVLLTGKLLGNVSKVTYTVRPGSQQPPGTAYLADSLYDTSQPKTFEIIQKSDSALLVRVPNIEGFSGPMLIDISVAGSGKTVTFPSRSRRSTSMPTTGSGARRLASPRRKMMTTGMPT